MLGRMLVLVGCLTLNQGYAQHQTVSEKIDLPAFSAVNITGNINANLHTGYAKSAIILTGDPRDLCNIEWHVSPAGVLLISPKKGGTPRYGAVSADIRSRYLNGLVYHGKGTLTGEHLRANLDRVVLENEGQTRLKGVVRLGMLEVSGPGYVQMSGVVSPHLHVKLTDGAKVRLTGSASLRRLDMDDHTWFSLSWVKTPTLIVRGSNKAFIQLAGIANKLDVELWDFSQLNARYLRARRAFVKTHDNSVAKISTTSHQHLLATDASDIRQYNLPAMKTDFMAMEGAILDMRAFNTAFVEEPTPYNK